MVSIENFRAWLDSDETKFFIRILDAQAEEHIKYAADLALQSYFKKDKNDVSTQYFGKADGILVVKNSLETCRDQLQKELLTGLVTENYIQSYFELINQSNKKND